MQTLVHPEDIVFQDTDVLNLDGNELVKTVQKIQAQGQWRPITVQVSDTLCQYRLDHKNHEDLYIFLAMRMLGYDVSCDMIFDKESSL